MVEAAEEVEAREGKDAGAALSPYSEVWKNVYLFVCVCDYGINNCEASLCREKIK